MSLIEKAQGKLSQLIPDYGGYLEAEKRRDEDKKLRVFIANKLNDAIKNLNEAKLEAVNSGNLSILSKFESPINKIMKYKDKIEFATYGYTGWFSEKKVDAAKLEEIQGYDKSLYEEVEKIVSLSDDILDSIDESDEINELIKELKDELSNLKLAINGRDAMMKD